MKYFLLISWTSDFHIYINIKYIYKKKYLLFLWLTKQYHYNLFDQYVLYYNKRKLLTR